MSMDKYQDFAERLADLQIGEAAEGLGPAHVFIRVPGGYVYQSCSEHGGACFIPEHNGFLHQNRNRRREMI